MIAITTIIQHTQVADRTTAIAMTRVFPGAAVGAPGAATLPPGGTAGQALIKQSATPGNAVWADVDDGYF